MSGDQLEMPAGLSWMPGKENADACRRAVQAGEDAEGCAIRVARVREGNELATAAVTDGETNAIVPYYGRALARPQFDVLVVDKKQASVEWVSAENGDVPQNAIPSGFDEKSKPIYVARVRVRHRFIPAKLLPRCRRAFVPSLGVEFVRKKYDVLCLRPPREDDNGEEGGEEEEEEEEEKEEEKGNRDDGDRDGNAAVVEQVDAVDNALADVVPPEVAAGSDAGPADEKTEEDKDEKDGEKAEKVKEGKELVQQGDEEEKEETKEEAEGVEQGEEKEGDEGGGGEAVKEEVEERDVQKEEEEQVEKEEKESTVEDGNEGEDEEDAGKEKEEEDAGKEKEEEEKGEDEGEKEKDKEADEGEEGGEQDQDRAVADDMPMQAVDGTRLVTDVRAEQVPPPEGLVWMPAEHGATAAGAVIAGKAEDGSELHVARATEELELASGMLRMGAAHAFIPYYGAAVAHDEYEVLANEGGATLRWEAASLGGVPNGAVAAGTDDKGAPIYVARVRVAGASVPGKLVARLRRAFAPVDGKEVVRKRYEVLCAAAAATDDGADEEREGERGREEEAEGEHEREKEREREQAEGEAHAGALRSVDIPVPPGLRWVGATDGEVPEGAVAAGTAEGETVFVARASEHGETAPGGVRAGRPAEIPHVTADAVDAVGLHGAYSVLSNMGGVALSWIPGCAGGAPLTAVHGGIDKSGAIPLFVARASANARGDYAAGRVEPRAERALVAWKREAQSRGQYEVLCVADAAAVPGAHPAHVGVPMPAPSEISPLLPLPATQRAAAAARDGSSRSPEFAAGAGSCWWVFIATSVAVVILFAWVAFTSFFG